MKFVPCFIMITVLMGAQTFLPVAAASFDCTKATSEVEKLICQNPELSRLDEEMAQIYQKALASIRDKYAPNDGGAWFKREQKIWLQHMRNACTTAKCLEDRYRGNIVRLTLVAQPAPKARRYPDVWGAELPTDGTGRAEEARLFEDRLGRVQILYAFNTATQRIYRAYSFFDKAILAEWRSERGESNEPQAIGQRIKAYEKEQVAYLLADERAWGDYTPTNYFPEKGGVLASISTLPKISPFMGWPPCTYGLNSVLSRNVKTPKGREDTSLMLIRIYPEPQSMDPQLKDTYPCSPYRLRGRGVNIIMSYLHDGTFLIKDDGYPLLIRFRPNLESPYLHERSDLFLVPEADMMRWVDEQGDPDTFDHLVVEKLTGK